MLRDHGSDHPIPLPIQGLDLARIENYHNLYKYVGAVTLYEAAWVNSWVHVLPDGGFLPSRPIS